MGRSKIPVVRDRSLQLHFSDVEFVKMLSLAVVTGGNRFARFDGAQGKLVIDSVIPDDVRMEISESMARLAISRKKIPKLTTKVIKLSNIDTNAAIKESNETLIKHKEYIKAEKERLETLAKNTAAKQAAKTK
jgi:hypothetical protein